MPIPSEYVSRGVRIPRDEGVFHFHRRRDGHGPSRFSKRPRPPRVPSRGVAEALITDQTPTRAY